MNYTAWGLSSPWAVSTAQASAVSVHPKQCKGSPNQQAGRNPFGESSNLKGT